MSAHHALRSKFTHELARKLLQGGSINLISPHGQGRRRTLEDLRTVLPATFRILQANLRNYPDSAAKLVADLCSQCGESCPSALESLLASLVHGDRQTLIILHNFDELQAGDASGYNDAFFSRLNSAGSRANISLLAVSEKCAPVPLHSEPLHSEPLHTEPLYWESLQLPALTAPQLRDELAHRNPEMTPAELTALAESLVTEPAPYTALEKMVPQKRR